MANPVVIGDGLHVHNVTSAEEARIAQAAAWAKTGVAGAIAARTGVVYAGSSTLLVGTATVGPPMTVLVKALHFIGAKAAGEGCYQSALAADTLVDVGAAPATNSRIDVVYVMQQDALSTTSPDGATRGVVQVAAGTSGVSPVAPSIPVGAVEVGQLRVFAGATTTAGGSVTITTTARWTAPAGSPIPVRNQTERDAITVFTGLEVRRLDLGGRVEWYNSSAWVRAQLSPFLAYTDYTTTSGGVASTKLACPGFSVTFTAPEANHRMRITLTATTLHTGGAQLVRVYVQEGATVLMTQYSYHDAYVTTTSSRIIVPTVGTHTYDVWLSTDSGLAYVEGAVSPGLCQISVEDLGA